MIGGTYFGLYPCGGTVSEKNLFVGAAGALVVAAVVMPAPIKAAPIWRITFPIAVFAVYWLAQSVAAPFYPENPPSISAFIEMFLIALWSGPC